MQRREITASNKPKITQSLDCDISLAGLEAYAKNALRDPDQDARWKQIAKVLKKAKVVGPGVARLRIEYAYSPLGRSLVEAGHCTGSRVYAIGVDPFKGWPKHMRGAAFHDMGWECDDNAAFPRAKLAMVPEGRGITEQFLMHREDILREVGAILFSEEPCSGNRRDWAKRIFSAYDNDATLEGWARTAKRDPRGRTVRGLRVQVGQTRPEGATTFKPEDYWKAQQRSSEWMWEHAGEELREFMRERYPSTGIRGLRLQWKSYVLQEAEAVSREAKIGWALQQGVPVHSLQHDCVVVGRRGRNAADAAEGVAMAREMSHAASSTAGYGVRVTAKWAEELEAVLLVD